jgi:hypothetical protein
MGRAGGLLAATVALGAAAVFAVWDRKRRSKGPGSSSSFDKLDTIVLSNRDGVEVHITPVGASIQRWIVPVQGSKLDVVLGFNKASTYAVSDECRRLSIVTKQLPVIERLLTQQRVSVEISWCVCTAVLLHFLCLVLEACSTALRMALQDLENTKCSLSSCGFELL